MDLPPYLPPLQDHGPAPSVPSLLRVAGMSESAPRRLLSPEPTLSDERVSSREALAFALLDELPSSRAELLVIVDRVLAELGASGYVMVRHDLSLHAYDAGRTDERMAP